MDSMVDDMEIIIFIGFLDVFFEFLETHEGPLVKFFHFGKRNLHGFSVEIRRIAQDVADGVADLAVHFGNVFDDFLRDADIAFIVRGRNPETNDIGTIILDDVLRGNGIAEGLAHLAAFPIKGIAVGQDGTVRSLTRRGNACQKGRLEPATMLVAAFKVQVSRPGKTGEMVEDSAMGRPGVKPNIHDVRFLTEVGTAAFGALRTFRQQFFCRMGPPSVAAFLFEDGSQMTDCIRGDERFSAVFTVEDRNRHAPDALTGNTPVMTVTDHIVDTGFTPARDPLDIIASSRNPSTEQNHCSDAR